MKKSAELIFSVGAFLALLYVGALRMWGKFGQEQFAGRRDEYLLHVGVGVFLGVTLQIAFTSLIMRRAGSWRTTFLAVSGIVTPILFLVLIHQTRSFLNDGPGTVSLGAGILASFLISNLFRRG